MQSRLDKQERLYYKNKVSDIISSYERQKEEEEKQKALIKKQIMLTIISNRTKTNEPKSEPSKEENTAKTSQTEEPFELTFKNDKPSVKSNLFNQPHNNPDVRFESEENKQTQNVEEITFNAKKRNKSLEEELTFKESYLNQLRERRLKEEEEENSHPPEEVYNHSKQLGSKHYPPVQKSLLKSPSHSSDHDDPPREYYEDQVQEKPIMKSSANWKSSYLKDRIPEPKSSLHHSSHYQQDEQDEYYQKKVEKEPYEEEEEDEAVGERERQKEEPKGVFLTMEESESMVAEEPKNKNYAFEIKMDKSTDPQDLEELKKQRIRQIQRKRQERIEEFRRNESQKKVEMPKGKNSYSKKPERDQFNESDTPPPRSATIERKNNPSTHIPQRPDRDKQYPKTIQVDSHESQYSIKPASSKQLPNPSYHQQEPRPPTYKQVRPPLNEEREKPLSPFKTPKSIASENNRGKSNGKSSSTNIFTGEQPREKSSNKYEPKIEPKDRKNSFTRQSNKKQMINAITYVIFPGELNRKERERLIDIIEGSQHEFFVFLFKEYSRKMIKAIYIYDSSQTALRRLYGDKAPLEVTAEMVQEFYKYDNGSREFKKLDGCRSFSYSIGAIDLRK